MRVSFSQGSTQSEARLQSPPLPPSSPYCQILWVITTALMVTFLLLSSLMSAKYLFWYKSCMNCSMLPTAPVFLPLNCLPNPTLLPSFFPKPRFHFHISAASAGSLRVLMQQAEGSEAILWSRSHNTVSHWTAESLPLGLHQKRYKVHALFPTKQLNIYVSIFMQRTHWTVRIKEEVLNKLMENERWP